MWQGPSGAELLVETTSSAGPSPRADWEKLDKSLARKYGSRYRSLGIRETTLAGLPAAVWEFELESKSGATTRKIDVAVHKGGRGYAVMGSAPAGRFDEVKPQIEEALNSFSLSSPKRQERDEPKRGQSEGRSPGNERARAPELETESDMGAGEGDVYPDSSEPSGY
jgi:hypothetical protein